MRTAPSWVDLPCGTMLTTLPRRYNLGWKLAGVIRGQLAPAVLNTYQTERLKVAQELIDVDYKLSRLFSGTGEKDHGNKEFKEVCLSGLTPSSGLEES